MNSWQDRRKELSQTQLVLVLAVLQVLLEADPARAASPAMHSTSPPSNNRLLTGLTGSAERAKVKILGKRALNTANLLSFENGTLRSKQ